jgi:cytochrome c6
MKIKFINLGLVLSMLLYACGDNHSSSVNSNDGDMGTRNAPVASAPSGTTNGQALFEQKCASCHGSDGTAGIASAANLRTSQIKKQAIANAIADGKSAMPSFKRQLSQEEISQLSNYVLTLRK